MQAGFIAAARLGRKASNGGDGSRKVNGSARLSKTNTTRSKSMPNSRVKKDNSYTSCARKRRRTGGNDRGQTKWQAKIDTLGTQVQFLIASVNDGSANGDRSMAGSSEATV